MTCLSHHARRIVCMVIRSIAQEAVRSSTRGPSREPPVTRRRWGWHGVPDQVGRPRPQPPRGRASPAHAGTLTQPQNLRTVEPENPRTCEPQNPANLRTCEPLRTPANPEKPCEPPEPSEPREPREPLRTPRTPLTPRPLRTLRPLRTPDNPGTPNPQDPFPRNRAARSVEFVHEAPPPASR